MKRYRSIEVLGQKVKIKWVKKMPEGHDNLHAFYDIDNMTITILNHGSDESLFKTLVHELVHAYQHRMGFLQESSLTPYQEIIAESLSNLIFDLFKFR